MINFLEVGEASVVYIVHVRVDVQNVTVVLYGILDVYKTQCHAVQ